MDDLHERDHELAALRAALESSRGGAGRVVLVEGEPGIGKSRLVAAAQDLGEGFEVLHARGQELERDFAFGCVIQLFEPHLATLGPGDRERALAGPARHAARLMAGLDELGERPPFSLLHGLFWLAANLAERRPLLLCLDDGHWADPASLQFLLYLAARIDDLPLAAVVAARMAEPGADAVLLPKLAAMPATTILRPRALGADSVGRIVAGSTIVEPSEAIVRALAETTGGNPLLVTEVLAALAAEAPVEDATERIRELGPDPVMRALRVTLGRLPPAATSLARAVAVLGDAAELEHAAELADVEPREASECAGALARGGVFRNAGPLGFAHPVLRTAVYEDLRPAERAFGHAAAARLLRRSGALAEQVAAQLVQAEPIREPWAVEALRAAATRAGSRGAPASAARYLERATREPDGERSPALLAELGRAEAAVGRESAAGWLARAAELSTDPRSRAEALRDLGRMHYAAGRFSDAVAAFARALGSLDGADADLALALRADQATAALWLPEGGAPALAAAGGLLDSVRAPRSQAERLALANVAGAEFLRGEDRARAVVLALRAWDGGALLRDGGPEEALISTITGTLGASDELAAAAEVVDATIAAARESGSPMAFASASYLRGALNSFRGRVPEAVADAEAAVAAGRDGWELFLTGAHWILALGLLERGEADRAAAVLTVPPELEERFASSSTYCAVRHGRGLVHLARGEPIAAVRELLATGELVGDSLRTDNPAFLAWRSPAAVGLARAGDVSEGRRLAGEELELARRYGAARPIGAALRASALVEPVDGDRVEPLREAVEELERSGARVELARALVDLGAALSSTGGPSAQARGCLRTALDLADAAGAVATATRACEELVGAGGRPRRSRTSGAAALTPAELRVARLAAEGRTNRQIAEHLFVTLKAVKWHLNNSYRKLGIDGRDGLASALSQD